MKKEFINEVMGEYTRSVKEFSSSEYDEMIIRNLTEGRNVLRNIKLLKIKMKNNSEEVERFVELIERSHLVSAFI